MVTLKPVSGLSFAVVGRTRRVKRFFDSMRLVCRVVIEVAGPLHITVGDDG